ncbi:PKD domain-containing protein [Hydrogenophaga sp. MI9]|uniref:PKD domain-containing protein n=1 Tax=Hydrogenophaga sp. MI9 TaxID=3453719 RepID=UPI003EED464D
MNAQALAKAAALAEKADTSQPLESLPAGSIASKAAYVSGAVARKAALVGAPAYRFYNTGTGAHFYTTSATEADNLVANFSSPFHLEGPAFWVTKTLSSGLSPVHRFFNAQNGVHFYTISEAERASLVASSSEYSYEGVAYYASQVAGAGLVPLYRFYVPSKGVHFYTTSETEKSSIQANLSATYRFEGVGYYVLDSASQTRAPDLGQTSTTVVAQLEATRLSGPAPLAVQFDASGTTSSLSSQHPFHQVRYAFNFGDDQGLSWPVSGLPKNTQSGGPLAAHVYDLPGTYQVRVRATDQAGGYSERSVTVEVTDPNAVYTGTGTICVSTAANFSGCPAGASQSRALPSSATYSGHRVLLRRGETFDTINIPHGSQNVQVGAFGTGAKPRVSSVLVGVLNPPNSSFPRDITIMDLDVLQRFEQFVTMSRLLLYRNTFEVPTGEFIPAQINIASALAYIVQNHTLAANQYFQPRELFVVENMVRGSTANPLVNMAGEGSRFVLMGNDMGTAQQHTVRIWEMHKGFIAHNALRGRSSDGIRVSLKVHSGGLGDYNDNYAISGSVYASRQIVIANNRLGDPTDNNSFTGGASPQNNTDSSREGLEDVVLESNVFYRGPNTNTEFILMGRRMTARGNIRADGGTPNISQYQNSYQLLPAEWVGPFYYQ